MSNTNTNSGSWRIERTGFDLPLEQTITLNGIDFTSNGYYGFIPTANITSSDGSFLVYYDPFFTPYKPETPDYWGDQTTEVFFNTITSGVEVTFTHNNNNPEDSYIWTDVWNLVGYIDLIPQSNGLYTKEVFRGEGFEQNHNHSYLERTWVNSVAQENIVTDTWSSGADVQDDNQHTEYTETDIELDLFVNGNNQVSPDLAEILGELWQPGKLANGTQSQYLMQPHYGSSLPRPIVEQIDSSGLAVDISTDNQGIKVRDIITYNIKVRNNGGNTAKDVQVKIDFDGNLIRDDQQWGQSNSSINAGNTNITQLPIGVIRHKNSENIKDINYQSGEVTISLGDINVDQTVDTKLIFTPLQAGDLKINYDLIESNNIVNQTQIFELNVAPISSIVFLSTNEGFHPWIGWDHVGLNVNGLIYEAIPDYSKGYYYDPGLGYGGITFTENDVGIINSNPSQWFDPNKGVIIKTVSTTLNNGVTQSQTLGSFLYDNNITNSSPITKAQEITIPFNLAQEMANKITEVIKGNSEYLFSQGSLPVQILKAMTSTDVQKGKINSETGKRRFTCVGLIEWAAEEIGYNNGQGFIPNYVETFHTGIRNPTLFPALTPLLLSWAVQAQNIFSNITESLQGILDPVDFIITDPLNRRLGHTKYLGTINEIPDAFYSGDGDAEQFFIPNPIAGDYQVELIGVAQNAFAAIGTSQTGQRFEGFLAEDEKQSFTISVNENNSNNGGNTILNDPLFRFQNSDRPGTYLFAGVGESETIRQDYPNFIEEGFAFNVSSEPGDDLIRFNRFQNSLVPGTYLYAGEEESESIRAYYPNFVEEGIAFYAFDANANQGIDYYRFQNTQQPGTYIFVGEAERQSILANFPNFIEEGIAFEVGI